MEINKDKLQKIKNEIFDFEHSDDNENYIVKLSLLDTLDTELKEILILIHSNQKATLNAIRNYQIRTFIKLIDVNTDVIDNYEKIQQDIKVLKSKKRKTIIYFLTTIMSVFLILWGLNKYDHLTTKHTLEDLKSFIGISKIIMK